MSELQKLLEVAIEEREKNQDLEGSFRSMEKSKIPITLRLDPLVIFALEHLSDHFDYSRSQLGKDIISAAVWDSISSIGLSLDDIQEMYFNSKKQG